MNGEDELHCHDNYCSSSSSTGSATSTGGSNSSSDNQLMRCDDSATNTEMECVPVSDWCDGVIQCTDASDEKYCQAECGADQVS